MLQVIIFFNLFNKSRGGSRFIWIFLNILILFQYLPRVLRIYQLLKELETTPNARRTMMRSITSIFNSKLVKGVYMFFLFILASHVFGALWYFFSYQREIACWKHVCQSKITGWEESIFDCDNHTFKNVTFLNTLCPISPANATLFDFGIFLEVLQSGMLSSTNFSQKFWRCFWWGLRNLSSFGQNLQTGNYAWENIFAVFISLTGMLLVLIYFSAILQMYMQSATIRSRQNRNLREMVAKRNPEIATWLDENDLPLALKEKIMTNILRDLRPEEDVNIVNINRVLRLEHVGEIKLSLCLPTLKKVPLLQKYWADKLGEGICYHLQPVIYNENRYIIRQMEALDKMLIITQGIVTTYIHPDESGASSTSNREELLGRGDFYGEELLEHALTDHSRYSYLPRSPRSVKCSTKVEGFVLMAKNLSIIRNLFNEAKTHLPVDLTLNVDPPSILHG